MKRPELLSPAGSAPAMVAAVQCGADAVYLGASGFNARRNAENFGGELDAAVGYCHARNTKVYVTLNTMVRQDELKLLEATIAEICNAGADGVIVQDFGTARAVRQMAPTLPLHASTQMAAHNLQAVDFLVQQGFSRVVLAREMSFEEIARCANRGAELEIFVHGALCVGCSGQCLLSSIIGGRSGNRGLCAQPCRMKYRLDDREGYLLSTKDLCSLENLSALIQAGADSLKIEGRLKRPEYVAATTATYRAALDGRPDLQASTEAMRQMFNRGGFTKGYGPGVEDAELMFSQRPNHLGVEIGASRKDGEINLQADVDAKDALVLRRGGEDVNVHPGALPAGRARMPEARRGDRLVRLVSQAQMLAAQASFAGEKRKFPVDLELELKIGQSAKIKLSDGMHAIACEGENVQQAQSRPADPARIRTQMEKLGDTPFSLRNYNAEIDPMAHLPVSALNALRRLAVERLIEARFGQPHKYESMHLPEMPAEQPAKPALIAQSGDPEVLRRVIRAGADGAVFAPEDLRIEALNAALAALPERFALALPPVMHSDTLQALHAWAQANAGRIERCYLSNVGQLGLDWPGERCGDYGLNTANNLSIAQSNDWGMEVYTPSVELNRSQIAAMGGRRELIVYGALPLMLLRHCPLRAAQRLPGKHAACRRCDKCSPEERIGAKALTDRTGASFPLRRIASDEGCVIQLLNSAKLMLLRKAASLPKAEGWRLLLTAEEPIEDVVRLHRMAIEGADFRSDPTWQAIEEMNTTTGHYFRGAE